MAGRRNVWMKAGWVSLVALVGLLLASSAGMAQTVNSLSGVACNAYNNNQANDLQRSHVRLYNPPTSTRSLWVVCGGNRDQAQLQSTASPPGWGYVAFFSDQSASDAEVTCIMRDYDHDTVHEPGSVPDAGSLVNSGTGVVSRPAVPPGVVQYGQVSFDVEDTSSLNIWTITCKLAPGTGLQNYWYDQQ
jgi:hypothetical protein